MRIAMVGPFGFHPNKTMRSRARPLAEALAARGHRVKIFLPAWQTPAEADRAWQENGVEIRSIPLGGGVPGRVGRLVRETLAWRPDVVHAFKPKAYSGLTAWWLWQFRRSKLRLVTDADDWEGRGGWNERAPYPPIQKRFFAWQERWGLRHAHALTVASRTLESLAWAAGAPPERVYYLPNGPGIPVEAGDGAGRREALGLARRPVLLLYSRLFEFDSERLVAVLQRVQRDVPQLAVLTVGLSLYQADAEAFRSQLARAGLQDAIVDVGWQEEAAVPSLLAAADVALYLMDDNLLNRTKCPVKLADLLQCGVPVVAEAVGEVPAYVVPGQSGRLRASGDVEGLATDAIALLCDPAERARLAAGARGHVAAHFSWARLAETAEAAYATSRP
jgi:glycosyltransferase involved in cell wall biosynthesis